MCASPVLSEDEAQGCGFGAVAVAQSGPEWAEVLGNTRARVQRIGEHIRQRQLAESSMQALLQAELLEKEQGKVRPSVHTCIVSLKGHGAQPVGCSASPSSAILSQELAWCRAVLRGSRGGSMQDKVQVLGPWRAQHSMGLAAASP